MSKHKTEISKTEIEVIYALAKCGLNPSKAARKMNLNRNTVLYHIGEIKNITGLNPLDFYNMVELQKKYKESAL